ncbi:MAG: Valine-tRNA ligase [Candidatus Magasanikbacteria bacterium GW2011_GWC2_37_14]|uniref:Valine--tRNA ligase n=1 Tax=Candidatus Magasanikbacteria bacterium GW2011_GWC2_37_14 TaxID=1619046 RepID=A0A0G0G8D6_9BACT|nr:MAG: Valine-tRNA ligase [Candidatus Magasanikbacteria bacterium GW2011_GWC2_37_14]
MDKAYEPNLYEDNIYKRWEESGLFNPDNLTNTKGRYVNLLPPPNANGEMHVGHASGYVVMDLLGRYHRMKGEKVLLLPGKDHAGIQSQVVYEKKIKKEQGISRHDLGREKFYNEIFAFCKDRSQYMRSQEKKIGLSADWSREKFTMDPDLVKIVLDTFVQMYNEVDNKGNRLIYRGDRIINWCPRCFTALSDVEVEHEEQMTKLYTFKYSNDFPFTISTTRPETKLGDTAVAVNEKDKRYKKYIGQEFKVDFVGVPLTIKIIPDHEVDMNFGTGALGVTPAHSAVDWEMAQKNNLPIVKVINEQARIYPGFGKFSGLSASEARTAVVEELRANGLLEKEEEYLNNLSVCERCKTPIEPLVSKQWFVNVDHANFSLKKSARKAIEKEEIKIYPERFKDVMLSWIDNVRDWCISRQIWWGPQIPVWYKGDEMVASVDSPGEGWKQDEDTFDTWFSSGQWAYSTLGYPTGKDYQEFYPSDVMIMGRDILPFWAFRMIILGLYCTGEVPFKNLYFTGLVRDENGQKMSKSKGNGIEPIEIINKYGTDAVRLSLLIGNTPGNDLNLGEQKIAGFRNFSNKLWNIARFIMTVIPTEAIRRVEGSLDLARDDKKTLADKWILSKLNEVIKSTSENIEQFNFSQAGEQLRDFTWNELADWYLEIAKIEGEKSEILNYLLNTILKLWHPFMPFVTEQIWTEIYGKDRMLMVERWPVFVASDATTPGKPEGGVAGDFELLKNIITGIRSLRAENKIEPVKKLNAIISAGDKAGLLQENAEIIKVLARLENLQIEESAIKPEGSIGFVESGVEVFVDLSGVVDIEKEKVRLEKEKQELEKYVSGLAGKLSNKEFVNNAPPAVVEKEQHKLNEAKDKLAKVINQLEGLR